MAKKSQKTIGFKPPTMSQCSGRASPLEDKCNLQVRGQSIFPVKSNVLLERKQEKNKKDVICSSVFDDAKEDFREICLPVTEEDVAFAKLRSKELEGEEFMMEDEFIAILEAEEEGESIFFEDTNSEKSI